MAKTWTAEDVLGIARMFMPACTLIAGAELGLFDALDGEPLTAEQLADRLDGDVRATAILADALTAQGLLTKDDGRYGLAPGLAELLTDGAEKGVSAMVRHHGACLRTWAQLAAVVRGGRRADRVASVRGPEADLESFIEAMNDISRSIAPRLIETIGPPEFTHLLDVGGGPATWTIEFLRARPEARATLLDLPGVIPIARRHVEAAGMSARVTLAPGNFDTDAALPAGADLAWVSAIIHMNSRQENRDLYAKVHAALAPGGRVLIRDVVMDDSHVAPADGAMFAVNMLVNTPGGNSYTLAEITEDLAAAGFAEPTLLHEGEFMESVIQAIKA